jgi:ABC-2 type transport system permease protein
MNALSASLWSEALKARRSKMFAGTLLFSSFIAVMLGLLMYVARHPEIAGRSAALTAKAPMLGNGDWPVFFELLIQMILALGAIGFAMVAAWVFGREYSDRTAKDLLALPVSRTTIVISKFLTVALWSILLTVLIFAVAVLVGLVLRVPHWSTELTLRTCGTFMGCAVLTLLLSTPVALLACVSRGYLLPVGFAILTLIVTNFVAVALPNVLPYFPWAIPALYSGVEGDVPLPHAGVASYLVLLSTCILGFAGTAAWWRFADQT